MEILKRKDFAKDADGVLTKRGHLEPLDDNQIQQKIDASDTPPSYVSSNESVLTVAPDPADATKFILTWVGAGTAQIQASADADLDPRETTTITGVLDLKLEEDEATTLKVVLDA